MAEWPGDSFVGVTSLNTIPKRGWIHSPLLPRGRGTGFSGVYRRCLDSQDVSFGEAEGRLLDFKKYQHGNSWKRYFCIYPGSPKTKLCPLVVGNPLHESSQRPFFVWSWTSSLYVYYFGYPLPSNTQQQNTCLGSGLHTFATFAGFRDVSQYFAWFFSNLRAPKGRVCLPIIIFQL